MNCRECGETKDRVPTGRRNAAGPIFVDESGRQWYGRKCPDCRYAAKAPVPKATKRCGCGQTLPPTRYFSCEACRPVLGEDLGDYTYLV